LGLDLWPWRGPGARLHVRYRQGSGWPAGSDRPGRFGHDLKGLILLLLALQREGFGRMLIEQQKEQQRNQQRGGHYPRQKAVAPMRLALGHQEIKRIADAHLTTHKVSCNLRRLQD